MDYNVATSFNRKKWFDKFKNDMEKIPKIDVVLDGANIGFANANRKMNRQNVYLNAQNIEWVIQELQDQGLQSFVILHHYHINHLLKSNPFPGSYAKNVLIFRLSVPSGHPLFDLITHSSNDLV